MRTVVADELRLLVRSILGNRSLVGRDAGIMAERIVHANLRGTDFHGVMRLPHYVQRLDKGSINPRPNMHMTRTGPATATLDGEQGRSQFRDST